MTGSHLLSNGRFDLFFVILDECQVETDQLIAEHIVAVHQGREDVMRPYFQPDQVRMHLIHPVHVTLQEGRWAAG